MVTKREQVCYAVGDRSRAKVARERACRQNKDLRLVRYFSIYQCDRIVSAICAHVVCRCLCERLTDTPLRPEHSALPQQRRFSSDVHTPFAVRHFL